MSAHDHREFVEGCFRCDLSRDEVTEDWPGPDYWCTICNRGAEGCQHTPADAAVKQEGAETDA